MPLVSFSHGTFNACALEIIAGSFGCTGQVMINHSVSEMRALLLEYGGIDSFDDNGRVQRSGLRQAISPGYRRAFTRLLLRRLDHRRQMRGLMPQCLLLGGRIWRTWRRLHTSRKKEKEKHRTNGAEIHGRKGLRKRSSHRNKLAQISPAPNASCPDPSSPAAHRCVWMPLTWSRRGRSSHRLRRTASSDMTPARLSWSRRLWSIRPDP